MDTQRPARLQSDNGTEFCAALMNSLCDLMGVEFAHGSVGHPESQVSWEGTFAWYSACSAAASKLGMLGPLIATCRCLKPTYQPMLCVQGAVERANQTIKQTIRALLLVLPTDGRWGIGG